MTRRRGRSDPSQEPSQSCAQSREKTPERPRTPGGEKARQKRPRHTRRTLVLGKDIDGAFVRQLRRSMNVSAREFGVKLGRSRSYVKSIESGYFPVSKYIAREVRRLYHEMYPRRKRKRGTVRTAIVIFIV